MPDRALTFWITFLVLLVASWVDVRERRIPNYVVAPYLIAGVAARSIAGMDAMAAGLAGLAIAAVTAGGLHLLTGFGMGDVKLLAALGWWVGPSQLRYALPAIALAGGALALVLLATAAVRRHVSVPRRGLAPRNLSPNVCADEVRGQTMPYAPAIAIGAMFSFYAH
jgi:prepilin peptidase CpaA